MENNLDFELMIPFPNKQLNNGSEIGAWMDGWENGYIECMSKLNNKDWDIMWEKMMDMFPYVDNRSKVCSDFILWQKQFILEKLKS